MFVLLVAFSPFPQRVVKVSFLVEGDGTQKPKQKSRSVRQKALESICAELNRPAGKGILQGKGSRLLYDCADVNGIIQIVAECRLPAF